MLLERWHVIKRAMERGYDVHGIWPCFTRWVRDDVWDVDVDHPSYPRATQPEQPRTPVDIGDGPGTELKRMLALLGFSSSPGCKCHQRALEMNERGVEWCSENLDTIVSWLKEEADRRRLPFSRVAASLLVRKAIRAAASA